MKWLEPYAAYARLIPALVAIAPSFNVLLAFGKSQSPVLVTVVGFAMAIGVPVILEEVVRDVGVRKQTELWALWRGSPTEHLLRPPTATHPDRAQRERWRSKLSTKAEVNLTEADAADEGTQYEAITTWAIENTRGHERLLAENKRYGYQRNLLALRPYGIASAVIFGVVAVVAVLVVDDSSPRLQLLVTSIALAFVGFWTVMPSKSRVWNAGDRYARALLDAATHTK